MKHSSYLFRHILYGTLLLAGCSISMPSCRPASGNSEAVVVSDDLSIPRLLDRKHELGTKEETAQIRKTYDDALAALKSNPGDRKQYLALATVFIAEGRITGNNGYYSNAAMSMLDKVTGDKASGKDLLFEALSLKSAVLLNMHQFGDALKTAEQGRALNDFNAGIYGALVDANIETGHYEAAVKDCDKMLGIRPDLRSYSRASYLRQIYGDNAGAISAMRMAVEAGVPGLESTEWARVNCGDLYFNAGKPDTARMVYEVSLAYRPGYPYAEMGLARVAAAYKKYDEAIAHARNAIRTLSEASFVSYLGDLYLLKGDHDKAMDTYRDVVRLLEESEREQSRNRLVHNGHRELAMAYLNVQDYDKALMHARTDYNMRPGNIDANDLMAWVLYKKGAYAEARPYMDKVFATKSKNANQLFKAGMLYAAAGDAAKGEALKKDALAISPYIDPRLTATANN